VTTTALTLGETIRAARLRTKQSLREIARMLEITPSYLSDIENDRRIPAEPVLIVIAALLNLDIGQLMAQAGRLSDRAERYTKQNPLVWTLIERIAEAKLTNAEIVSLIRMVRETTS
jgi:transcriptional regulator with XRE-family HTH domain